MDCWGNETASCNIGVIANVVSRTSLVTSAKQEPSIQRSKGNDLLPCAQQVCCPTCFLWTDKCEQENISELTSDQQCDRNRIQQWIWVKEDNVYHGLKFPVDLDELTFSLSSIKTEEILIKFNFSEGCNATSVINETETEELILRTLQSDVTGNISESLLCHRSCRNMNKGIDLAWIITTVWIGVIGCFIRPHWKSADIDFPNVYRYESIEYRQILTDKFSRSSNLWDFNCFHKDRSVAYFLVFIKQFLRTYPLLLEKIFDIQEKIKQQYICKEKSATNKKLSENDVEQVGIDEDLFDYIAANCFSVQKRVFVLIIKTVITSVFFTVTIFILVDTNKLHFLSFDNSLALLFIFITPKLVEIFADTDPKIDIDNNEEQIEFLIKNYKKTTNRLHFTLIWFPCFFSI
ncbi:hypothetical protein KUTeg_021799 [Tegillarca granosa]|uniref:Uncharacterized protein n=1 Tax=Tegillarca granosa TaxID=220873 RepID=A0ABQ9E9X4_TEGGR|nr:hypothetical protein KUTeg_021799 [Tegillarca granosa]